MGTGRRLGHCPPRWMRPWRSSTEHAIIFHHTWQLAVSFIHLPYHTNSPCILHIIHKSDRQATHPIFSLQNSISNPHPSLPTTMPQSNEIAPRPAPNLSHRSPTQSFSPPLHTGPPPPAPADSPPLPHPFPPPSTFLPPPRPRPPLHPPLQLTSNPPPIKIPLLRHHFLPINKALPRRIGVETQIPLQGREPGGGGIVGPYFVFHGGGGRRSRGGGGDVVVCGAAFPFAEGGVRGGKKGEGEGAGGEVVC